VLGADTSTPLQSGQGDSGPASLRLTGPSETSAGQSVTVIVHGLPAVDLTQSVGEQTAWVETLRFAMSGPDGVELTLDKELSMTVAPWGWRLRVSFVPPVDGVYVLVCDWNQEPFGLALHRMLVGPRPPPPDPPVPPPPPPGTLTGAAYLIAVRPEQPTADQARDLLDLRVWVDSQPAGKIELLEVTRDQRGSSGDADPRLSGYLAKVPSGEPLPYLFLVRQRTAGGSYVFHEGRLSGDATAWIDRAKEVLP